MGTFWGTNFFLIPLGLLLSIFSYYVVEKPFRNIKWENRKKLFAFSIGYIFIFTLVGFYTWKEKGLPNRMSESVVKISSFSNDPNAKWLVEADEVFKNLDKFYIGDNNSEVSFVFWGDSHSLAFKNCVDYIALKKRKRGLYIGGSGCFPSFNLYYGNNKKCKDMNSSLYKYLVKNKDIKVIISTSRYEFYLLSQRTEFEDYENVKILKFNGGFVEQKNLYDEFKKDFYDTINKIEGMGKTFVYLSDVPEVNFDVPSRFAKIELIKSKLGLEPKIPLEELEVPYEYFLERNEKVFQMFKELNIESRIKIIYLHKALCDNKSCKVFDKYPLYYDDDHLSTYGAMYVCDKLENELKEIFDY